MIKYKQEMKSTTVTDDITCDICGKSCNVYPYIGNGYPEMKNIKHQSFMSLEANWGYGSNKDMTYWKAQICEKCVDEKLRPLINFEIGSIVGVY